MAYFPLFVELSGQPCLIVGGGSIALRKAEKLLGFGARLTVTAPEICAELAALPVKAVRRPFAEHDIDGMFLVIAATDDPACNHRIYALCTAQRIPVNAVDDAENCSFLFPALVHAEPVTVGICTGGKSPTFAKHLRRTVQAALDAHTMKIAQILAEYRPEVLERFSSGDAVRRAMDALLDLCLRTGELPDDAEIRECLEQVYENQNRNAGQ